MNYSAWTLRELQLKWPSFEIKQCCVGVLRYDIYHPGLTIPFGSVVREPDGVWWWMTPAVGFPGREPQAPKGHKDRYGRRQEGTAPDARTAMAALLAVIDAT